MGKDIFLLEDAYLDASTIGISVRTFTFRISSPILINSCELSSVSFISNSWHSLPRLLLIFSN